METRVIVETHLVIVETYYHMAISMNLLPHTELEVRKVSYVMLIEKNGQSVACCHHQQQKAAFIPKPPWRE